MAQDLPEVVGVAAALESGPRLLLLAFLFLAFALTLLWLGLSLGRRFGRMEAERGLPERLIAERGDAVKRSRAVLGGQAAEQLSPYFPGFPFDPTETRFLGKPVDLVVFRGSSAGVVEEVVFVEVKTGSSRLSRPEASLRDCVEAGRVRWMEYRPRG